MKTEAAAGAMQPPPGDTGVTRRWWGPCPACDLRSPGWERVSSVLSTSQCVGATLGTDALDSFSGSLFL